MPSIPLAVGDAGAWRLDRPPVGDALGLCEICMVRNVLDVLYGMMLRGPQ